MAYRTVQFGTTYGSLGTVGYRLRSSGGTWGSRVTAGVSEEATGSGTYTANVDESSLPVQIKWDTTDGSTINAIEDITPQYVSSGTGTGQIELASGKVSPADSSIGPSTPTSDFAPQIGGDILNLAAGDLINTNPNGVGNLIIATKTAVDALTTAVAAIPTTSGGGGTSGGNGFF